LRFFPFQMLGSPQSPRRQALNSTICEWSMKRFTSFPHVLRYHLKTGGSEASNIHVWYPNLSTSFLTTSFRHLLDGRSSVIPSDSSMRIFAPASRCAVVSLTTSPKVLIFVL